jgi:hypothetical protein
VLFNIKKNRVQGTADCLKCNYFKNKKCGGLGKVCFEYDAITQTIFDPLTHLPITIEKEKQNGN